MSRRVTCERARVAPATGGGLAFRQVKKVCQMLEPVEASMLTHLVGSPGHYYQAKNPHLITQD